MVATLAIRNCVVYESPSWFYVVGSAVQDEHFWLMKIDRQTAQSQTSSELNIVVTLKIHTRAEIDELLRVAAESIPSKKPQAGLPEKARGCGLLGFVHFLEGYYLLLVTKASEVARLGYHSIFKIEDTAMLYIPSDSKSATNNVDESRYLRMFQSVDLGSNFYFSYTYDLTHTLQENVVYSPQQCEERYTWNSFLLNSVLNRYDFILSNIDFGLSYIFRYSNNGSIGRWFLRIIHGYVAMASLKLYGSRTGFLLIARRSNKFAGTRFLKRGANFEGRVANEVETEQIVFEASSVSAFERGLYTSFVQYRGSVPVIWSQDQSKVVAKPPIQLDLADPFAAVPGLHFQELRAKYRDPVVVLNLVKRRERHRRESLLNDEFLESVAYLNQFLEPTLQIRYLGFDMSRCHKTGNALEKLDEIAYNALRMTGWFQTFKPFYCHQIRRSALHDPGSRKSVFVSGTEMVLQSGLVRTNCVDCTDRTNTAQFLIGKVALAFQLYALGLIETPELGLETECVRIMETLYEEQGNILALYAGSHLVHSVRTYKKVSAFQERSRDVIQSLSRYYSNTFSDTEKQMAINLFLGVFRPAPGKNHIWDLITDAYLHYAKHFPQVDYCAWFEDLNRQTVSRDTPRIPRLSRSAPAPLKEILYDDNSDYAQHYEVHQLSVFDNLLASANRHVQRVQSLTAEPTIAESGLSFLRSWKKPHNSQSKEKEALPADDDSGDVEDEMSSDEEQLCSETETQFLAPGSGPGEAALGIAGKATESSSSLKSDLYNNAEPLTYASLFPSSQQSYGIVIRPPSEKDMQKYQSYCLLGQKSVVTETTDTLKLLRMTAASELNYGHHEPLSGFDPRNSCYGVVVPSVLGKAIEKYRQTVLCAAQGPKQPSSKDKKLYEDFVSLSVVKNRLKVK